MFRDLEKIIKNNDISTVFQPIFDIENNEILGFEALARGPVGSELYSPDALFKAAINCGVLSDLEMLCRENAIMKFSKMQLPGLLFLNISPLVLLDPLHPQGETVKLAEKAELDCSRIVIELSEKYPFPEDNMLKMALAKYREFGFNVAIDDLGAGYAGLKQWSELEPHIVKVDRYFVENCHLNSFKRKFLIAIFDLAESANTLVVVEGIESEMEYNLLCSLGLKYAQGFYLARPSIKPQVELPKFLLEDKNSQQLINSTHLIKASY